MKEMRWGKLASHLIYKIKSLERLFGPFHTPGIIALFAIAFFLCCVQPSHAVTNEGDDMNSAEEWDDKAAVIIENADKITWATKDAFVELTGNVNLVQGSSVLLADYVKITLAKSSQGNVETLNADLVEKLEAVGNIQIELDFGTTTAETAVYDAKTKIFILTGDPAKFIDNGKNEITGSTITVNRETGTVEFERSDQNPVEGVIFPNGRQD